MITVSPWGISFELRRGKTSSRKPFKVNQNLGSRKLCLLYDRRRNLRLEGCYVLHLFDQEINKNLIKLCFLSF